MKAASKTILGNLAHASSVTDKRCHNFSFLTSNHKVTILDSLCSIYTMIFNIFTSQAIIVELQANDDNDIDIFDMMIE